MEQRIEVPAYARVVVDRLESMGYAAYVVGGCVRDSLMGRTPKDWDVCTNATPKEVLACFRRFHVIKTGLKHGTVTVMSDHEPVEVTTFRIDGEYTDNRHPDSVTFVDNVAEDLARRDFTINAMAYSPKRGLVDVFGGREDLAKGQIRCVGEPDARFNEDGLRILRALRFASRFGFGIEQETAFSIRRNRHLLENVSSERIFKELKGILVGDGALDMLLAFPEVFSTIIPELQATVGFDQHTPYHCYDVWTHTAYAVQAAPADEVLRLTMLLHDIGKPSTFTSDEQGRGHFYGHPAVSARMAEEILERLKSDNATKDTVVALVREHDTNLSTTRPGMRRFLGLMGERNTRLLMEVKRADQSAQSAYDRERKFASLRAAMALMDDVLAEPVPALTIKDLAIKGGDLIAMGMAPGRAMGHLLETLLNEVQDETLPNTPESLLARARDLLQAK